MAQAAAGPQEPGHARAARADSVSEDGRMPGISGTQAPTPVGRRTLGFEVWVVLALSLGASAVYSILDLIRSLGSGHALRAQSAVIEASAAPNRSLLDLAYQLVGVAVGLAPVLLVAYLLMRSGESLAVIGLDRRRTGREAAWGAGLAALIGGAGLAFYIGAYHLGMNVKVVPTTLPPSWWRVPVLVLLAFQNGALEEVVVCGYLLHRLEQLDWSENRSLLVSAVLRGSYHLYQGFGAGIANAVMGLVFGRIYQRRGRLGRLVMAHGLIDTGAFVGYVLLHGHVSWLP
jgi:membrane protease YdiL (CAAX protease family)